jgi:hypothetical protein
MEGILADLFQSFFDALDQAAAAVFQALVGLCISNPLTPNGYMSFPWIPNVTFYLQGIALAVVVVIRVATAAKDGILKNGGDPATGLTFGQWLFQSLWSVSLVCAMPAIMHTFAAFSFSLAGDILSATTPSNVFTGFSAAMVDVAKTALAGAGAGVILAVIAGIVVIYYITTVLLQCLKRQVQMVLLSVIAPLVAISGGTGNSADIGTLLKETVGLGVISGLQLLFLVSTVAIAPQIQAFTGPGVIYPLVVIAMFGAIKKLPGWVEQYIPNSSTGPANAGRNIAGGAVMLLRSFATKMVK